MATIHYNAQATSGVAAITSHTSKSVCGYQRKGRQFTVAVTANPEQITCKRCVQVLSTRVSTAYGVKIAETRKIDITPADRCEACGYYTDSTGHATSCN